MHEPGAYWFVVDGAADGQEGEYEITVHCDTVPTPTPTTPPTEVPTPTPTFVPSSTLARSNCVCMSDNMIANIKLFCPVIASKFVEGCMFNVTRAHLAEYSKNCSALKADWGPYFRFADDDYGSIRGYPEGNTEEFKNKREYDEPEEDPEL